MGNSPKSLNMCQTRRLTAHGRDVYAVKHLVSSHHLSSNTTSRGVVARPTRRLLIVVSAICPERRLQSVTQEKHFDDFVHVQGFIQTVAEVLV